MATCQTERWVSTSPYVKLTVDIIANNPDQATLRFILQYIADYGAANTSVAKNYSVTINGKVVASGTYNIDGKTNGEICSGYEYINKTHAAQTISCKCGFAFNLTWSGKYGGTKSASTTISVAAKNNYTISYLSNGGSGAPSAQTKWYNEALTLSSTKPTRTGYTFLGWSTSNTATSASYAAGETYTTNAAQTFYAVWKANTYTISYNANGGKNAPASQTKKHGVALTLAPANQNPTRTGYTFMGWSTNAATSGNVMYKSGASFTTNANTTLYAVWELSYIKPKLYNISAGASENSGFAMVYFDWETTNANPTYKVAFIDADGELTSATDTGTLTGTEGHAEIESNDAVDTDTTWTVQITLTDSGGSTIATTTLSGNRYPIDVLAEGKGISFGGPASLEGVAHFQFDAKFDKPVSGLVRGLGKLPMIPQGSDFNAETYRNFGVWAVYGNADSKTISNMPPLFYDSTLGKDIGRAGILEVYSPTGEGVRSAEWSYIRQRFIPYSLSYPIMERDITRNDTNAWAYDAWYRTSLTPDAAKKVYDEPVTLFNGSSDGTITLSDNIDNYEYLEIFFTDNNGEKSGYTKMHKPYSSVVNLFIVEAAGTNTYIRRTSYAFSGNKITPDVTNAGFLRVATATASHTSGTNYIKITRVLGRNS